MTVLAPPTCEDLWEEDGYERVHREVDDSWRHGCYVAQVFHREADDTHWCASYRVSTDGETNDLRDGLADIIQVRPEEKTIIVYVPVSS